MAYSLDHVRVLVVDDMKPMLTLVQSVLKAFGFKQIILAQNGDEAFEALCRHDPDIVLTDWMMEPQDGLEFTKRIRRDPASPNPYVPVVMMTGFSSRLRVESARDQGITEFLVKPFAAKDLYDRIVQVIERPRQFVDSGEFFGPDRRRKRDDDYEGPFKRATDDEKKKRNAKNMGKEEQRYAAEIIKKLKDDVKSI